MAWSTPKTWADGDIPTGSEFNVEFRDRFNTLALHSHGSGSGSGGSSLGPITWIQYVGAAAPGGPGGTLTRSYATNGTMGWVNPAGTAFLAGNSTHEHTLANIGNRQLPPDQAPTSSLSTSVVTVSVANSLSGQANTIRQTVPSGTLVSTVYAVGGAGQRIVALNFVCVILVNVGTTSTFRYTIQRDSTVLGTRNITWSVAPANQIARLQFSTIIVNHPAGTFTFEAVGSWIAGADLAVSHGEAVLTINEVAYTGA